ncbi:MAG: DUF4097 domain-containing protein, partial [Bacteroidetes bacterium]|nr:DUF4097 domain-containing protein [Bacteroidota bacterium]
MKKSDMKSKWKYLLLLLAVYGGIQHAGAQILTESRKVSRSFSANNETTVDIQNKYGKVHIVTWDKDSVRVIISMQLQSDSEERISELKRHINFDFTETPTYLIVRTDIGPSGKGFFGDLKDIARSLSSSGNEVQINYKVFLPEYVNLKVSNKYGDIYASSLSGDLTIRLDNGDLKADNFRGRADIEIQFGDAVVNSIGDGRISLNYAEIYAKEAGQLTIDSKSSKITIDKVESLKINSKRDKFYVKEIDKIYGSSSFSDFWIHYLSTEASCNIKYGHFNMEAVSAGFSFLNFTSRYTDLGL